MQCEKTGRQNKQKILLNRTVDGVREFGASFAKMTEVFAMNKNASAELDEATAHKGLEGFFRRGETKGIQAQHLSRIQRILDLIDDAADPQELKIPGMFLYPLKGDRKGL